MYSCEDEVIAECNEISISATLQSNGAYLLEVESADLFTNFKWTLDTLSLDDITSGAFELELGAGTYELCLSATSESCGDLVNGCITFTVEGTVGGEDCPEIGFEKSVNDNGVYLFDLTNEGAIDVLWTVNGDTVSRETRLEKELQPGANEVCVIATFENCASGVSYCEVVTVDEVAEECPEVSFEYATKDNGLYVFELINENPTSVLWTLNGDTVSRELALEKELSAGAYEVCVYATFENCESGVTYCESIEVAETCPEDVKFGYDLTASGSYVFTILNEDATIVEWLLDGQVVGTGKTIEKDLGPGTYSMCVIANFENCSITLEYCEDIVIAEDCPEVRFGTNNSGNGAYEFVLGNTDGLTTVIWEVNGDIVGQQSTLEKTFDPGTFEVCVTATYENCPSGVTYCETITVEDEGSAGCPDMFFAYDEDPDVPNKYRFYADFMGIENLEWYGWYVDGVPMEDEGTINEGDNYFEFTFNEPGTHEVCILTETPDCPSGASYCKEIVIEPVVLIRLG